MAGAHHRSEAAGKPWWPRRPPAGPAHLLIPAGAAWPSSAGLRCLRGREEQALRTAGSLDWPFPRTACRCLCPGPSPQPRRTLEPGSCQQPR